MAGPADHRAKTRVDAVRLTMYGQWRSLFVSGCLVSVTLTSVTRYTLIIDVSLTSRRRDMIIHYVTSLQTDHWTELFVNYTFSFHCTEQANTACKYCTLGPLDWIMQCFTSPPTQYRLYGRPFLQVKRPNQQYQSTEGTYSKQRNQTINTKHSKSPSLH